MGRTRSASALGVLLPALVSCFGCMAEARAQALTYRVGGDNCDFSVIQPAIDAAAAHPGPDTIRVAMNATYTAQALKIGAQDLSIEGGYASCASAQPTSGARTEISGLGGVADSVIEISGDGIRELVNLVVRDGDEIDTEDGGGIDFAGAGQLSLLRVTIALNRAGYGGGIAFAGTGPPESPARLVLGADVLVQNNIARNSGGGVRIEGNATQRMDQPRSAIIGNEAQGLAADSGYGGGIQVLRPASAEIGSPGLAAAGAISGNRAKRGGGLAIGNRDVQRNAYVLLYTTDANRPGRIDNNIASIAGGGIYLDDSRGDFSTQLHLCAYEFRLDHNRAPEGAALFLDSEFDGTGLASGSAATLNAIGNRSSVACGAGSARPRPGARLCAAGVPCNSIDGNAVAQPNGQPADGAIIELAEDADLLAERVSITGNTGTDVIHGLTSALFRLGNCLIADNVLAGRVLANDADNQIVNCTIAGNSQGLSDVLALTNAARLENLIIWQPGHLALGATHGPLAGSAIITNDPGSIPLPDVSDRDPRFVDPAGGDYRLQAASPAVDCALLMADDASDLDGLPRDRNLLRSASEARIRDLGAYERQALDPLVLNASFNTSLAQWFELTPAVSAFAADENAPGSPLGGAMGFDWLNTPVIRTRVASRAQCVHLPLPGSYRLNGTARTVGGTAVSGQRALLHWELRHAGNESCTAGAPDAQGDLPITSGTSWASPQAPASIPIAAQDWTADSSITISTVMVATGVVAPTAMRGWFDEINLLFDGDPVFGDGFE